MKTHSNSLFPSLLSVYFLFLLASPLRAETPPQKPQITNASLMNAVVRVFVTANKMDYYRPWQSQGIKAGSGSGAIIEGKHILTNAHVVADHTFIQVKKDADSQKYTAKVIAIDHDCDLALLEVNDPLFFADVQPLSLGELPKQKDNVTVIGYPQGGDTISITEGVVSRVEVTPYAESSRQLLTVQIDAAINPGNSGGPVVRDGKLVGIAMQVLQAGQNIGYMIPSPIIKHFLNDLKDGVIEGFPLLGIDYKNTENPTLRDYYGITKEKGGVLISRVVPFSSADGYLKEDDVILAINDVSIGEDGTFPFRGKERLSLTHLITSAYIGDTVHLKIIRQKKAEDIDIPIKPFVTMVPHSHYFEKPPYYIYGGLVFTVLSTDLIESWGSRWWEKAPLDLTYYVIGVGRLNTRGDKEIVVLLNVLPDDINVGYHDIGNDVILKVNGREIKSFRDLVSNINELKNTQKYTIIETEHKSSIVLNNEGIDKVNQEILKRNNIPFQFSSDVAQWLGKAE